MINICTALTAAPEATSRLVSAIPIVIAVVLVIIAVKLFRNIAKTVLYIVLAVAGVLLLTGIVDFAMIQNAGYSIWDWMLNTEAYQYAREAAGNLKDGVVSGIKDGVNNAVNSTKDSVVSGFNDKVSSIFAR